MTRGSGDFFRCMQKIRERFCSRADNRTEVIGEKRREDDTTAAWSLPTGGWLRRARASAARRKPKTRRKTGREGGWHTGSRVEGGGARGRGPGERGRESRLQVFRSLMCDLPQTRQSVPPFPSGSAGFKESALGPPATPPFSCAFLQNPTGIPYYTATAS